MTEEALTEIRLSRHSYIPSHSLAFPRIPSHSQQPRHSRERGNPDRLNYYDQATRRLSTKQRAQGYFVCWC